MGLLDDAIREHLELKRRRGADAGEITRQEREALGPARRESEPAAPAEAAPDAAEVDPFADEDFAADAPAAVSDPDPFDDFEFDDTEPTPTPQARAATEPPPPVDDHHGWDDQTAAIVEDSAAPRRSAAERLAELDEYDARGQVPPPAAASPPPPPDVPAPPPAVPEPYEEQATTAFSASEVEEATRRPGGPGEPAPMPEDEPDIVPADDGGEDLLEETPDFLEETPEHDRLWFEQRPPRDFDFDG